MIEIAKLAFVTLRVSGQGLCLDIFFVGKTQKFIIGEKGIISQRKYLVLP